MRLTSMGPASLTPSDTLTVSVEVTNTSREEWKGAVIDLGILRSRTTDRAALASWSLTEGTEKRGSSVAQSTPQNLAPGETAVFTLSIPASELQLSPDGVLWGPRRVSLTLQHGSAENPIRERTLRTFVVWTPEEAVQNGVPLLGVSYLTPVRSDVPAQAASDPAAYAKSLTDGSMSTRLELAARPEVDWLLDPSMLAEVPVPSSLLTDAGVPVAQPGQAEPTASPPAGSTAEGSTPTTAPAGSSADANPWADPRQSWAQSAPAKQASDQLAEQAGGRTVLASPYGQLAPEVATGSTDLSHAAAGESDRVLESRGVTPQGSAVYVTPEQVTAERVRAIQDAGASTAIVPAESMRSIPDPQATPSAHGQLAAASDGTGAFPLLGYDLPLTTLAQQSAETTDPILVRQRVLADTSVVAGQSTNARRNLLIAPNPTANLDPAMETAVVDALGEASWVEPVPTERLLADAKAGNGTQQLWGDDETQPLWNGPSREVHPTTMTEQGQVRMLTEPAQRLGVDNDAVTAGGASAQTLMEVRSAYRDPQLANASLLAVFGSASTPMAANPGAAARLAEIGVESSMTAVESVSISTASSYNLVSDSAGVPLTITNRSDTPVTVTPRVSVSKRIVRLPDKPSAVTVPARGQSTVTVPIEAIANGDLTMTVELATPSGATPFETRSVQVRANPAWENRTTLVVVIAMALLVVAGVVRASRRKGMSDARSPGIKAPEPIVHD